MQMAMEQQAISTSVADVPVVRTDAMDVDAAESSSSHKRKAEDVPSADAQGSKKPRTGELSFRLPSRRIQVTGWV
jgi:hypothetical protein